MFPPVQNNDYARPFDAAGCVLISAPAFSRATHCPVKNRVTACRARMRAPRHPPRR